MNEALPKTMTDVAPDALSDLATDAKPLSRAFLASLTNFLKAERAGAGQSGDLSAEAKAAIASEIVPEAVAAGDTAQDLSSPNSPML